MSSTTVTVRHLLFWEQQRGRNVWTHFSCTVSACPPALSRRTNELVLAAAGTASRAERRAPALGCDLRTSSHPEGLSPEHE